MNGQNDLNAAVVAHWGRRDAAGWILSRLESEGILRPDWRDVARYDQIHAGGLRAVKDLAALLPIECGQRVADLGAGLGGSARYLAEVHGCNVVCVDLTPAFVEGGRLLTERVGLGARVEHMLADATAVPLPSGSVDGVWVQHLALQVRESGALWREAVRLLKPGGWFGLHEWVRGTGPAPLYPSPWAPADGHLSFLNTRDVLERELREAGLTYLNFIDVSTAMRDTYSRQLKKLAETNGDHPLMPPAEVTTVIANAEQNLREARAACLMGTARKAE